jgi:ketosteroid isomerase-like protein
MSQHLIDLIRRGYESWNQGDRQWVLDHMSEEVEWIAPPEDPDPGVYRGHAGVEQFWAQWRAEVGQLKLEPEEVLSEGDQVLVVALRSGRGEHSGLDISDRVVQVFSFEGDICFRVRETYDRDQAMAWIREGAPARHAREAGSG